MPRESMAPSGDAEAFIERVRCVRVYPQCEGEWHEVACVIQGIIRPSMPLIDKTGCPGGVKGQRMVIAADQSDPMTSCCVVLSPLDDAKATMRAGDRRVAARATAGVPDRFVWVAIRAARPPECMPRLAAVLLHDDGYRTTSIVREAGREGLGVRAMLRLFRDSAAMFMRDADEPIDTLRVFGEAFKSRLPSRFAPTASMPAYVSGDGTGIMILRQQSQLRQEDGESASVSSSSTVVTALLASREEGRRCCRPTDAGAMRTVMTTTERADRTLAVSFWPPVGAWIDGNADNDAELRVWHVPRDMHNVVVDLMAAEGSSEGKGTAAAYPRLCKMGTHAARDPVIVRRRHIVGSSPSWFEAVAEVTVHPDWPDATYLDERVRLQRLGRAHEVARRHDAALRIQAAWREAVSSPDRLACRRRLRVEFGEFMEELAVPNR